MKTKVIVLLSIVLLVFSVPAFADGISGDANYQQQMEAYDFQGGTAILDANDNIIGGEMYQESGKRMMGSADSSALIDCEDCGEVDAVGGFTYQSAGADQSQFDGQVQVGVFGHADINIDKYMTMKTTKSGDFTFDKTKTTDVTVTKNETKYKEEHKTETTVVDVDKASTDDGDFDLLVEKDFDVHADGELKYEDETINSSDETSDTTTNTDTWSAEGNLNVDKDLHVAGSGSHSSTDNFDLYKEETKDKTEWKEETFDHTVDKDETLSLSGTYAENCEFETHSGKTIAWNGNGVMGAQVQGGHQSGYVQSTTVAGAVNFDFDPVVRPNDLP
jgi:hypothetical protein